MAGRGGAGRAGPRAGAGLDGGGARRGRGGAGRGRSRQGRSRCGLACDSIPSAAAAAPGRGQDATVSAPPWQGRLRVPWHLPWWWAWRTWAGISGTLGGAPGHDPRQTWARVRHTRPARGPGAWALSPTGFSCAHKSAAAGPFAGTCGHQHGVTPDLSSPTGKCVPPKHSVPSLPQPLLAVSGTLRRGFHGQGTWPCVGPCSEPVTEHQVCPSCRVSPWRAIAGWQTW